MPKLEELLNCHPKPKKSAGRNVSNSTGRTVWSCLSLGQTAVVKKLEITSRTGGFGRHFRFTLQSSTGPASPRSILRDFIVSAVHGQFLYDDITGTDARVSLLILSARGPQNLSSRMTGYKLPFLLLPLPSSWYILQAGVKLHLSE